MAWRASGVWTILGALFLAITGPSCTSASQPARVEAPAQPSPLPLPTPPPPRPTAAPPMLSPALSPVASPVASPGARAPRPRGTDIVRIGALGSFVDMAHLLGLEQGYFAEQGIKLVVVDVETPEQLALWLSIGRLEAGADLVSAALLDAAARGVQLRIAAEAAGSPPGRGYFGLAVRRALVEDITQPGDLRDRRIGLAGRGTPAEVELAVLLKRGGLSLADVTLVPIDHRDMLGALASGAVDLAMLPEPWASQIERLGAGTIWRRSDQLLSNHTAAVLLLAPHFIRGEPDLVRRYMTAYLRAARLYNDAFFHGNARLKEETGELLVRIGLVPGRDQLPWMVLPGLNPNGMVDIRGMRMDQDYYVRAGLQQRPADLAQLVDLSYAGFAITRLGEYR